VSPSAAALVLALAAGSALWVVSLRLRDASIVDLFWGPLFVLMTLAAAHVAGGRGARRDAVVALVVVWAARLSSHLARRNLGHGEDRRYADMRRTHGTRFWLVSLFTIFLAQPLLAWVVAAPLFAAVTERVARPLGALDLAGGLLFAAGFGLETVADLELRRFRAEPSNHDRVLASGLWRYSRHPNYFGEFLLWWGFGLFGLAAGGVVALLGPLLMSVLLLRVSGVTLLERTIDTRRPDYARYRRSTSAFVPWPPRSDT